MESEQSVSDVAQSRKSKEIRQHLQQSKCMLESNGIRIRTKKDKTEFAKKRKQFEEKPLRKILDEKTMIDEQLAKQIEKSRTL